MLKSCHGTKGDKMANERELRVEKGRAVFGFPDTSLWQASNIDGFPGRKNPRKVHPVVILECSEGRCGDFEEWMVAELNGDDWEAPAHIAHLLTDEGLRAHIASAISRVLQEANDGR